MSPTLFNFKGNNVRVIDKDGALWFNPYEAGRVLGIRDVRTSLRKFPANEKGWHSMPTPGGAQNTTIINEAGLYRLIFQSRKAEAEEFKTWIFSEVIPAIRKTGQYSTSQSTPPAVAAWLVSKLMEIMPAEKLLPLLTVRHPYGSTARNGKPRCGWRRPAYVAAPHREKDARAFQEGMVQLNLTVQLELPQLTEAVAELERRAAV